MGVTNSSQSEFKACCIERNIDVVLTDTQKFISGKVIRDRGNLILLIKLTQY